MTKLESRVRSVVCDVMLDLLINGACLAMVNFGTEGAREYTTKVKIFTLVHSRSL